MADLSLDFGGDLVLGPTGDFALADGSALTAQRVLRRLLTNPGGYVWQLSYGAGLGQFVGQPGPSAAISGTVRAQIKMEAAVARNPAPTITVAVGVDGTVALNLRYADVANGQTNTLTVSV